MRDRIIEGLEEYDASGMAKEGVIHGDPVRLVAVPGCSFRLQLRLVVCVACSQVFSNVIATPSDGLKLVDMRGKQGDVLTLRGDVRCRSLRREQSCCPL